MTEKKQKSKSTRLDLNSKFWKTFFIVLAVFLTFAGPTYIVYVVFLKILKMNYACFDGLWICPFHSWLSAYVVSD